MEFGARHLKRSIERHLVFPLSNVLATGQIEPDDVVTIDFDPEVARLTFRKKKRGALAKTEPRRDSEKEWAKSALRWPLPVDIAAQVA